MHSTRLSALSAVAALLLAGCASDAGADAGTRPSLLIWTGGGAGGEATQALGARFGEENGVDVKVQIIPEDLQTQFVTASQAGRAPDVVMGAHDWIGNLVQNATIDPLQMTDDTKAGYQDLAIKAVTFNGQVYGMPFTMNNIVLFRNTALVPDAPTSIEDLVAKGKALKAAGKVDEILALPIGPTGDPYHINPLFTSGGGYIFGTKDSGDFDPSDLGVAKPGATAAYAKIRALGEGGSGALKRSITADNILSLFSTGKAPFMISGPWQLPELKKTSVKYDISPVPPFAGGQPARPFITVDAAYVASRGTNKALAQEFVTNFWSRPDVGTSLYAATSSVPALKEALATVRKDDALVGKVADAGVEFGQIMPSIPAMAVVWDPLGKAEAAVVGGADPGSTITAAASAIQAQIK
ncbi:carbohydrate ABC transporter substrate-binding protein (CUT1 family) [Asanoa ferruginea]|uniref:Carbohydrate ABC transporter substrate-binding protein (CUT1 family) n=1 Tax=Asanoa ferruginea TaxID=53367 RepID=A0A3D9ZS31_9ACTN|nr:extracellular solute-binding protein [Asanoa ferruginea]REF99937.1 carbohydrate ABC transporter substrate-binding protein (CUT1 family) [Asanoa ferruginea]GIF53692.1 sugar ABC transporter substrate-binding protein [Asanoa ferruginea]